MSEAPSRVVLFICQHGAAKSVVAAQHLRRLAQARGVEIECLSAGVEPENTIPPHVVAGLAEDGFAIDGIKPRLVTQQLIEDADRVVSFGCDLTALAASERVIEWNDVPAVSDGYSPARDTIVTRLGPLLDAVVSDDARH